MSELEKVVETVKSHVGEGMLEPALVFLEKALSHNSPRYNDLVQIKSRFNSQQRELLLGLIDHKAFDLARNNISQALLLLADDLKDSDLADTDGIPGESEDKRGDILYCIPDHMQLGRDEKCIVRIAFALTSLLREWERTNEDVMKDIRISDIMGVQLLNLDDHDPPFLIKTLSEQVQFIDKDDFTEWIYYVRPLKAGQYPLMLRVSVIEMINNKEYKKDIVLEERVTVLAEVPEKAVSADFKAAGAALTFGVGNAPWGLESAPQGAGGAAAAAPAAEAASPAPEPAAPPKKKKRLFGALMVTAALAAVTYFGVTTASNNSAEQKNGPGGPMAGVQMPATDSSAALITDPTDSGQIAVAVEVQTEETTVAAPEIKPVKETDRPKNRPKTKPNKPAGTTSEGKTPDRGLAVEPKNDPPKPSSGDILAAPSQEPPTPVLRGSRSFFKIPRFRIVDSERQIIDFFFFQYNEYQEVLAIVSCLGDALLQPGMELELIPSKGESIKAPFKYVARAADIPKRFDGYFMLNPADVKRLTVEKIKGVRIYDRQNQVLYPFKVSKEGAKMLNRRAEEALKNIK